METSRPRPALAFEVASLAAFAAALAGVAASAVRAVAAAPLAAAAGAAFGALAADLASGLVHFLCDRFGSERTPLLGPYLIAGFREHHREPEALLHHGLLQRSGANAFAALPALALGYAAGRAFGPGAPGAFALGAALAFAGLVAATNEIHRLAHLPEPPRVAAWLQRLRLLLPPEAHARHHRSAHDSAYCIATGWSNALLDRAGAFAALERRLGAGPPPAPRRRAGAR